MTRGIIDMLLWRRGAPGRDPVNQQIDTSNENQEDHFQFQDLFLCIRFSQTPASGVKFGTLEKLLIMAVSFLHSHGPALRSSI